MYVNNASANAYLFPVTASSEIAGFLSQSQWQDVTPSGYTYSSYSSNYAVSVDRDANGYFDGIFISWANNFIPLEIGNVVLRINGAGGVS